MPRSRPITFIRQKFLHVLKLIRNKITMILDKSEWKCSVEMGECDGNDLSVESSLKVFRAEVVCCRESQVAHIEGILRSTLSDLLRMNPVDRLAYYAFSCSETFHVVDNNSGWDHPWLSLLHSCNLNSNALCSVVTLYVINKSLLLLINI